MKKITAILIIASFLAYSLNSCKTETTEQESGKTDKVENEETEDKTIKEKIAEYATVRLTTNVDSLSESQKEVIKYLIKASDIIDNIYWKQTFGDNTELLSKLKNDDTAEFVKINYGPWDRLRADEPIIDSIGKKPIGANFYPPDIKYLPFISLRFEDKLSMYTLLRRNDDGDLYTIPYHKAFKDKLEKVAEYLNKAAKASENKYFADFLKQRAKDMLTDKYYESDLKWMDIKNNKIDIIIGPIQSDEDQFINTKTAYQSLILVKDKEWSNKLCDYIGHVNNLVEKIPVEEKYKNLIGSASDIGVYDAIYYAGRSNAGGKNISINHPKDGRILMEKGNKKLQFKNVMKAKFDKILNPICKELITKDQQQNVKFEAFFINNLFYEIVDGLKIKNTVNDTKVKNELKNHYNVMRGLKADALRLLFITYLEEEGKLTDTKLEENYLTFVGDLFRSVRFGTTFFQGKSNMILFNNFIENGVISRNEESGKYSVDIEKMKTQLEPLTARILKILSTGDYDAADRWIKDDGLIKEPLKSDLKRLSEKGVPRDVIFEQGINVLGI